jgi:hypothetical protein
MKLAAVDTRRLLDDLTSILLALRLLRDRTPLSTEQAALVGHALGSARHLARLAVDGIAGRKRIGGGISHEAARAQLGDELDGTPDSRERERLAAHLEACPSCRAFGRTLESTVALLRQLPRAEMPQTARADLRRLVATATGREMRDALCARAAESGTGAGRSDAESGATAART